MYIKWFASTLLFDGSHLKQRISIPFNACMQKELQLQQNTKIRLSINCREDSCSFAKKTNVKISAQVVEGIAENISLAFSMNMNEWNKENYVFVPGAVYNGNRFPLYPSTYPPIRCDYENYGVDTEEMIGDIPRLSGENGKLQFHAGDMTTPAVGIADIANGNGYLVHTKQCFDGIETGLSFTEEDTTAFLEVAIPGVKQDVSYRMLNTSFLSKDKGKRLSLGEMLNLELIVYEFNCPTVQSLFDVFFNTRKMGLAVSDYDPILPFNRSWGILEEKFNNTNWEDEYGYYSMGSRPPYDKAWILGWPGMMIYPMLLCGNDTTKQRALRNIDYMLDNTQAPTGFFYASSGGKDCFGDHFKDRTLKNWNLIRRNCDGLFYLIKCLILIEDDKISYNTLRLKHGIKRCVDAFVCLWKNNGQLGQFIDVDTGEIIIGSTASGALSIGALALCGQYFKNKDYIETAQNIGEYYFERFVAKGMTNGGPGEILQAPDSESSYAMLAGFVTLYEVSKKAIWLERSEQMAKQFATWCMSYNYPFPIKSEFASHNMKTIGTVFANAQNKHSAPGICTHSGVELLKLYCYTEDLRYLQLIKEIAGTIPQYLSRDDRPIRARDGRILPHGWMHERVNTSDWEDQEGIGEVGYGNCWCSVSLMMVCAEIPGIYIHPDKNLICSIDHVQAKIINKDLNSITIEVYNPTKFDTKVSILVDSQGSNVKLTNISRSYQQIYCSAMKKSLHQLKLR